jgi:hypothetical protein
MKNSEEIIRPVDINSPIPAGSETQPPTPVAAKPVASAADLLAERVSDRAIGGGVPLEGWLRNNGAEWALQYVGQVFAESENESELLFAAEASFTSATELVCHVLKRGGLDGTYGELWYKLLAAAKRDVEQFRKENAADQDAEAEPEEAPLPEDHGRRCGRAGPPQSGRGSNGGLDSR